jgi:hypothetical protein
MTSNQRPGQLRFAVAAVALGALIGACGGNAPVPSASTGGNKPTVVLQSPTNGAAIAVGQSVSVAGAASDTVGVDHVALFVDAVSVATTPAGQPAPLVPFSLAWLATPAGPHVLQVIAYRADGTASDPAVANVVVGGGSIPVVSGASLPPISASAVPTTGGLITPPPTKKPRPSKTPRPPTPTPAETTPPAPTPTPSADSSGNAPDDSNDEPYEIALVANNSACPAIDTGVPVTASGCIWEQISAPAGDVSDELEFTQAPDTSYHYGLTACTDTSGATAWSDSNEDVSSGFGCMQFNDKTSSGGNPGSQPLFVGFKTVGAQLRSVYQLTVYQCKFADCASQ